MGIISDYVKFGGKHLERHKRFGLLVNELERQIHQELNFTKYTEKAIERLEECHLWIGKAVKEAMLEDERNMKISKLLMDENP